jgi:hypothetical protein
VHHAVQAGRVDPERLARLGDGDAGTLANQGEQLLLALTGRRAGAPRAAASARRRRRRLDRARRPLRRRPRRPATARPARARRCDLARGGTVDAKPLGDRFELAVLGHGGLELLQTLSDALLGVAKLIKNGHGHS